MKNKLLYVLPIYSYDPNKHTNVYHPMDYPDSKSDIYLLKNTEFSWINHDSILKLNDIRTVSVNRILYQHKGTIDIASDTYKGIEALVLKKYFAEFYFEFESDKKMIESLKEDNAKLEEDKKTLQEEIEKLKAKLEEKKKRNNVN